MPSRFPRLSIRAQAVALCLLITVPLLAWQGYETYTQYQTLYRHEVESNLEIARAVSRAFTEFVDSVLRVQTALIISISDKPHTPGEISHILVEYQRSTEVVLNIVWLNSQCRVIASSSPDAVGMDLSDRPNLVEVAQGAQWSIGNLIIGRASKLPVFQICKAVRDEDGHLKGIMVSTIGEEQLEKALTFNRVGRAAISLVDRNGMLVFRNPSLQASWEERNWLRDYPHLREVLGGGREYTGTLVAKYDGKARVVANVPLPFGWGAGAGRHDREVTDTVLSRMKSGILVNGIILIASALAVAFFSTRIAKSIKSLQTKSDSIGRGERTPREYTSSTKELQALSRNLDAMSAMIREREEQFRALTQNLVSAVALINERGEISIVNKAFLRLFDLAEDADILNVNSRDWSQWQVFDEAGRLLEVDEHPVRRAALTRAAVRDMLVAVKCPGCTDRKWMLVSAEPILDAQGNLHLLICTYHDITERKRAEEMLRESEQRFRLALKNSPVLVAMQDSNLVYQWAYNTRTRRPEDVIGKTDADLFAPEDLPSILEAKSKVLHTGQVVRQEQWLTSNGQRVFLDTYLEPVRDSGGKILGIRIAAVNLTEQKRAEEALRQSREDLDRAQAVGQTGWWRLDTIDNVLTWSQETHRIFGVPEGAPMSYEFFLSIVHPEDRQYVDTQWQAALRGEPYDIEHRIIADGRVKWVRERAYLEFDNKGELLGGFGITQDITARKEAQAAVERMRVMLEEGQKIAHVGSWEYLADAQTTVWSDEQCRIYGIDPAAGSPPYDVMLARHIHPDDASALHEAFSAALRNHATYEQEHRIVRPDGSVRVLYERALPYFDENGKLVKYMGVSLDITERKGAEDTLRRLNESLESKIRERTADLHAANQALEQRASQLRELAGELTAAEQRERKSLAKLLHDGLQQYLVAARMRQSALIEDLENHSAKKSAIEIEGILIESISVSRSLAMELCPPALDGGILSGLEWLSRFMASKQGLDVNLLLDTGSPVLPENVKVFLFESVRELLLNVVKHSKTLSAKVHLKEDNQRLRVTVSDAGVGLDVSALQRRDSGGGFGLFSIRERIGLVGGSIEIDSQPGMGARFTITVPLANPDSARPATPPTCSFIDSSIPLSDSKVRILLVDDHKVVREGLAQMLGAEEDFEIVGQAEDGNGAVELTQMLRPQIVLMDVTMPNMDGITATRIITKRHPEVRIVGLSLYSAEERAEEMIKAGARLYVSKTAPAEDLKKAIRRCVC